MGSGKGRFRVGSGVEMSATAEIVPVGRLQFEALRSAGKGWVCVRPVCEMLRLDFSAQRKRLERQPWATVAMMAMVGADGRDRDMFCIDAANVAQWLVTIDTSRIKDAAIKANLGELQISAGAALDRWFRGPDAAPVPLPVPAPRLSGGDDEDSRLLVLLKSAVQQQEQAMAMRATVEQHGYRLALVENTMRENAAAIVPISPAQPELPPISKRKLINEHVNRYASAMGIDNHTAWRTLYFCCDRRLNIAIGKYKLAPGESKLDRLASLGLLDKVGKVCDTD